MNKTELYESFLLSMGMLIALGGDKLNPKFLDFYDTTLKVIKNLPEGEI